MNKTTDKLACPICGSTIEIKPYYYELSKIDSTVSCGLKNIDYICDGMPKHVFNSLTVSISKSTPPRIVDYELSNIIMREDGDNE